MTRVKLHHIYAGLLLTIFALIVVHAPLSVFFGSQFPDFALIIKAWKEILMAIAVPIAVILLTKHRAWGGLFRDKLFWLILAYVGLHLVMLVFSSGIDSALAGLAIDLRYIVYFSLVYVLMLLYPGYQKAFFRVGIVGAVIVIVFALLQQFLPNGALTAIGYGPDTTSPYTTIDRNYDFVRHNSTLRGPNPLGAYAASVGVLLFAYVATRFTKDRSINWWIVGAGFLAALVTYLSYSRSAYVALAVGVAIVAVTVFGRRIRRWQWGVIVASVVIVFAGLFALRDNAIVSNIILHEDPAESGKVNSNDDHLSSLQQGIGRMIEQPLGRGVGSTGSASLLTDDKIIIENQYLFIAHEVGWIGLAIFLAIFIIVLRRLWAQRANLWALGLFASGIGLALIGILLPVWVDDTVSIVWWGLAAVILGGSIEMKINET